MRTCVLAALAVVAVLCAPLRAGEEPGEMGEILERLDRGEPLAPEQLGLVDRFAKRHLVRVRCSTLEEARFSLAQLQLKAGRPEKAAEALQELAKSTQDVDVKSAALYDLGKVYRFGLRDVKQAADAFQKVDGRFRSLARRDLLNMYQEAGQIGKAVEYLQTAAAAAKDKGEKLALLRRLGQLCKRAGKVDDAIAAYQQITEQFTDKDIKGIREAAVRRVTEAFAKCRTLKRQGRWREIDQLMQQVRLWLGQLAADDRLDEFRAAQAAVDDGWRRVEQEENQRERAERGDEGD